jgi:hypothetical protein
MVGELVGRNKKRPERGVFIEALAETKAAIGLFQPISINVISPVFIGVSGSFLCQSISSATIKCHI